MKKRKPYKARDDDPRGSMVNLFVPMPDAEEGIYNAACPDCGKRWLNPLRPEPKTMLDVDVELERCPGCLGGPRKRPKSILNVAPKMWK